MKKTTTLLTLILLFAVAAYAGPVDPEKALEIANSFWKNIPGVPVTAQLLEVGNGPSKSAGRDVVQKTSAQYYIFSARGNGGFVIVSGDDRLTPVVGYSTEASVGEMPPALVEWLAGYSNYVDDVRAGVVEPAVVTATAGKRIEPMLKTSWNQSAPYNNYCPEINGQKTPTGCTATATAQVMKFHEWPVKPTKAISWINNITGTTETIDITKNTYDWTNMLPHYRDGYTTAQANAVAQLMVDVGKAIGSNYALAGTGSSDIYAARALVKVFDYSPDIRIYKRNECTHSEYITIIRDNLEAQQPLVVCGQGQSFGAGHAFVCDGIDENNLLHIDWGWDGAYNGFFDIGSMAPGGTGIGGGQDRYNVCQSIIANVRPREADEQNKSGEPTIFTFEVVNAAEENAVVNEYTTSYSYGNATFKTLMYLLNWSHSTATFSFGTSITSTDGTFNRVAMAGENVVLAFEDAAGYYIDFSINTTNPANKDYLKEGTYYVEIVYSVGGGEPVRMKGENTRLILEVGKSSAKLSKALPEIEVSGFEFRSAPQIPGDNMVFDVALRNTNIDNATVVVVPIVNRMENGNVVESDTIVSAGAVINVYDDTDVLATYSLSNALPGDGDHYVSFAYDMRNSYTDHNTSVEKIRLKSIAGRSHIFTLETLPPGPIPMVSTISAPATMLGNKLTVTATITNIAKTNVPYSGKLGLFTKKDVAEVLLATSDIKGLVKGGAKSFSFASEDYVPFFGVGTYEVYVCEFSDGVWERIRHNGEYRFTLKEPSEGVLYAASEIVVDADNVAIQGDSVDVIMKVGCLGADFDGYIRVNTMVSGTIKAVLRSAYVPVSVKNGETVDVNLRSLCNSSAPLQEWDIAIKYFDADKREIGALSKNTLEYPGNGYFWVADATAVDAVREGSATVTAGEGCVVVSGDAAVVNVYSLDGRTVYSGAAATVPVENGVYIVNVVDAGGNVVTVKVLVK